MKKGIWTVVLIVLSLQIAVGDGPRKVSAAEAQTPVIEGETQTKEIFDAGTKFYEDSLDQMLETIDLAEVEAYLEETDVEISFWELVQIFLEQEGQVEKGWLMQQIFQIGTEQIQENRTLFIQILILCAVFALLKNFALVFQNSQIHQTCFYVYYMALVALLLKSYLVSSQILAKVMEELIGFMQVLVPAFAMALSFSTAISTAALFYQIILSVIYLIDRVLLTVLLPAVHIYVVLLLLNLMTGENLLSGLTNLLKKGIEWALKLMLGAVTGINVLQNLISPAVDALKNTALTRAIRVIPGLGTAANAVTDLFLGAAVVIKNGVGVAALVVLLLLVLAPFVKMLLFVLLYKLTGAVVQPIADKRICQCINGVGEGAKLLLKMLLTALLMFFITIAMVTASVRW